MYCLNHGIQQVPTHDHLLEVQAEQLFMTNQLHQATDAWKQCLLSIDSQRDSSCSLATELVFRLSLVLLNFLSILNMVQFILDSTVGGCTPLAKCNSLDWTGIHVPYISICAGAPVQCLVALCFSATKSCSHPAGKWSTHSPTWYIPNESQPSKHMLYRRAKDMKLWDQGKRESQKTKCPIRLWQISQGGGVHPFSVMHGYFTKP